MLTSATPSPSRQPPRLTSRARLLSAVASVCLLVPLAVPAQVAPVPPPWDAMRASIFRIFGASPGFPFECTGWYLAAAQARPPVSVYVTTGHCPTPLLVRTGDSLEVPEILARLHSGPAGADLTIGERADPRSQRIFLPVATTLPHPGERAVLLGYGSGSLTALTVTASSTCQRPFICFDSDTYIENGLSGSPIVSVATGEVLGVLAASPARQSVHDPYVIIATPAPVLRATLQLALPGLALP